LPCSYAGALQSSADGKHNLFYWLFRNPASQSNSPFTIWLNGGPGSSSLFGLFNENGPLRVTRNGTGADDFQIGLSPDGSWFDLGDILFIDQPVGTGFSFTNSTTQTYLITMDQVGDEFIMFLNNFLAKYPDYGNGRPLTFSGESYAGKYLPFLSTRIVRSGVMNLTNVVLGNPYTSPVNQRTSTYKVAYSLGIIDSYNRD
jgi:carboxypeptidase C (cathepsin A)